MKNLLVYQSTNQCSGVLLAAFIHLCCFLGIAVITATPATGQNFMAFSVEGRLDEVNATVFYDIVDFNTGTRQSFEAREELSDIISNVNNNAASALFPDFSP